MSDMQQKFKASEVQCFVNKFNGTGYDKVHLLELKVGDRYQILNIDDTVYVDPQGFTDRIVTKDWQPDHQSVRSKPYKSEDQLFDEAYEAYKEWPDNGGPNWSGNSPNPWEAFFAGYKAALGYK